MSIVNRGQGSGVRDQGCCSKTFSCFKSIGTKNESSLHKTLKYQYAGPGGFTEAETGEFVADGIRADGEYIEVQTGNFAPLRKKIKTLTAGKKGKNVKIRIIHPIAINKIIEVYSPISPKRSSKPKKISVSSVTPCTPCESLKLLYRRKSPKKGSLWNIFDVLIYAPELPLIRGVTIEAVLADITEKRLKDGKGSWRRKGVSIKDRELTALHESIIFENPRDYLRFIPFKKGEEFTTTMLAEHAAVDRWAAGKALYALTKIGVVERIGKKGNSWLYMRK